MPQIFKGSFSSELEKIWAQIRQGAFDNRRETSKFKKWKIISKKVGYTDRYLDFVSNITKT